MNCKDCGAKMVQNPKTGKTFCSNKCWLQQGQQQAQQAKPVEDKPDWEAKDRMNMAMSAIKAASIVYQGQSVEVSHLQEYANNVYNWLQSKKREITKEDIPF